MSYWKIAPEIPAEIGSNTVMDTRFHPPRVERLHLEFVGWLGSDLIECFPCYAVSSRLALSLGRAELRGFEIEGLEMTLDDQFREMFPDKKLPEFFWLRVAGRAGVDDFGINQANHLVVSDAALALLRSMRLEGCDVEAV